MPMRLLDILVRIGGRPEWARRFLAYRLLQTIVVSGRGRRISP